MAEAAAEIAEQHAARHDRENTFPTEAFDKLRETGYLALTVPREFGGGGVDPLELCLAQERLSQADGSVGLASTMHLCHVARLATTRSWPAPLFARLCREIVQDGALINSAASEPDLGSPSRGGLPSTTAVRCREGWRLNGHKRWASLAPVLRYATVLAAMSDGSERPRRANFLVPMDHPGVRIDATWDNLGMRATGSHDLVLTDVVVDDEALLPTDESPGVGDPRGWTLVTAAVYTGIAMAARDFAVEYARGRRPSGQSGTSVAEYPAIQQRVAQIDMLILQSRAITYGTAETWVERPELREEIAWQIAAAKYLATNNAIHVTDLAMRVVGSAGSSRGMALERHFRDVRAGLGNPPMDDIALSSIGQHALGL